MRLSILTVSLLLVPALACTPAPAGDDEANVTTVMSESGESETSSEPNDTSSTSTDDGVGFWDAGELDIPSEGTCDVWTQDCPEGEKCVPASDGLVRDYVTYQCVPIMGDQAPGEPCTLANLVDPYDDCDASSICFDTQEVDGQLVGTCFAQCTGSLTEPMCTPGMTCAIADDSTVVVCIPACDPLAQDCEPGQGCFWTNDEFTCVPTTQDIPTGEPCEFVNDCASGNLCIDASYLPGCAGVACCSSFCDLGVGDPECAGQPGTSCAPFFEQGMAPAGYESVGVCVVP